MPHHQLPCFLVGMKDDFSTPCKVVHHTQLFTPVLRRSIDVVDIEDQYTYVINFGQLIDNCLTK